ncbi:MAG: heavy-metal-associated domain-containing protein [Gemmataceae bacterium]
MKKAMIPMLALALAAGVAAVASAQAPQQQARQAFTQVTLTELHCMGCAKKISTAVHKVSGVAEMRVDLNAKTVFVMHKAGATPSPKELWQAIETADHTPTRMVTPTATHTSKPAS